MKIKCPNEVCILQNKVENEQEQLKDNINSDLLCSNFSMLESFNQLQVNNDLFCTQSPNQKFENEIVFTTKFNYKMFQIMKNHFSTLFKVKYTDEYFQNIYNNKYFTIFGLDKNSHEIMCFANLEINISIAKILTFAVVKEFQNKKVGSKLLKKIIEELTLKGISYILLIVQKCNKAAVFLYQKFGFIIENELPNYYNFENSSENNAYEMKRALKIDGFWIFDIFKLISSTIIPNSKR